MVLDGNESREREREKQVNSVRRGGRRGWSTNGEDDESKPKLMRRMEK